MKVSCIQIIQMIISVKFLFCQYLYTEALTLDNYFSNMFYCAYVLFWYANIVKNFISSA